MVLEMLTVEEFRRGSRRKRLRFNVHVFLVVV